MATRFYDLVVVGGGAAGQSAALVLGRARRRVAVVEDDQLKGVELGGADPRAGDRRGRSWIGRPRSPSTPTSFRTT